MTAWPSVVFRPDEDRAALRDKFARLWARNPEQSAAWAGLETFKGLPDAIARGGLAGSQWQFDSEVIALRDQYRYEGDDDYGAITTKEQLQRAYVALYRNKTMNFQEKKAHKDILDSIGKLNGLLTDTPPPEKPAGNGLPVYNIMKYTDDSPGDGHSANRAAV